MDLITEFDARQQLCAVVDLLDGKDHCAGEAQFTRLNSAHRIS